MKLYPRAALNIFLAGAAGDAIGAPFEGQKSVTFSLPEPPWHITDDTLLTLATCRAIGRAGGIAPEAIADEFVSEYRRGGLRGVGSSTLRALRDLAAGQHWALAGARGEFSAGNGPAMRAAPLAFLGDAIDASFQRTIKDVASITHRNDEAAAGALCVVLALQMTAKLPSITREELLKILTDHLPDTALSDSLNNLRALPADAEVPAAAEVTGTTGRTAESVALAVFIGSSPRTIAQAIEDAVSVGNDTDTIASIAAQLRAAAGETVNVEWQALLPITTIKAAVSALTSACGASRS